MFGLFGKKKKTEEPKRQTNTVSQSRAYFAPMRPMGQQEQQSPPRDDGFAQSMMLGYAMNDGLVGGLIGGNFAGGVLGDAMNTSEPSHTSDSHCHDSGASSSYSSDSGSSFDSGCSDSGSSSGGD